MVGRRWWTNMVRSGLRVWLEGGSAAQAHGDGLGGQNRGKLKQHACQVPTQWIV